MQPGRSVSFKADEGTAAHTIFERCMRRPTVQPIKFLGEVIDTSCTRVHAPYSPSASKRWLACPGSVNFLAKLRPTAEQQGAKIKVTAEMCAAVKQAVGYARKAFPVNAGWVLYIETEVQIPATGEHGHIDLGAFNLNTHELHVLDYKHGTHPVVAKNNTQCMLYALGLKHAVEVVAPLVKKVVLHIAQPRVKGRKSIFSKWEVSLKELEAFAQTVKKAVKLSKSGNAPFKKNPDCYFCEKDQCDTYNGSEMEVALDVFADLLPQVDRLTFSAALTQAIAARNKHTGEV